MKTKFVLLAVIITAMFLLTAKTQAQPNVPILEVDTLVNLSKVFGEYGEAYGACFLPDGNIIVLWNDTPLIIDSKTGEIIRQLDKLNDYYREKPTLTSDGSKFLVNSDIGLVVYDVASGHIIKNFGAVVNFCISKDNSKLYVTKSQKNIVTIYDLNTYEEIGRIVSEDYYAAGYIDVSPDGQTLALDVYSNKISPKSKNLAILIELNNNNSVIVIETLDPNIESMAFSPDGKHLVFQYNDENSNNYIYIYNLETKEKKYIKEPEVSKLLDFKVAAFGEPFFIDNKTIIFGLTDLSDDNNFSITWNIYENKIKNIIKFPYNLNISIKGDTILFCNFWGVLAYLDKTIAPVQEKINPNEAFLKYSNNQLEFISEKSFTAQASIYDISGKLIADLGSQSFVSCKNIIQINQALPIGVYILTINNGSEQNSYKFIVE